MIGEPLFHRNLKNEIFELKILKQAEKDRKLAEKGAVHRCSIGYWNGSREPNRWCSREIRPHHSHCHRLQRKGSREIRHQALTCNRCIFMQWRIKSLVRCGYCPGAASLLAVCRLAGCPAPAGADGCTGWFDRRSRMQRISAFSACMPAGWSEPLRRNSPPWERSRLCCKRLWRFGRVSGLYTAYFSVVRFRSWCALSTAFYFLQVRKNVHNVHSSRKSPKYRRFLVCASKKTDVHTCTHLLQNVHTFHVYV